MAGGRRTDHGLGSPDYVALADARKAAAAIKARAVLGRYGLAGEAPTAKAPSPAFKAAADEYRAIHAPTWADNTREGYDSVMRVHVLPKLGRIHVDALDAADVLRCVGPLYAKGKAAARPARRNIRNVLDLAVTKNWIASNPADRTLDAALPKPPTNTDHHGAIRYVDAPAAYAAVSALEACSATLALRYLMLTGVRSSESRGAQWAEIEGDTWTIPAERCKTRRAHAVPLSAQTLEVLAEAKALHPDADHVFRAKREDKPLTDARLPEVLREAGVSGTVHGWRSTLRDWCAETGVDHTASEHMLGHAVGSAVQQAYARTTLLEQRRQVMQDWGDFLGG